MKLQPHEVFNNSAASYRHIEAIPLAAAMDAEVRGVDVANLGGDEAGARGARWRLRIWHGFLFPHDISSA